jgi:hypothetical protein
MLQSKFQDNSHSSGILILITLLLSACGGSSELSSRAPLFATQPLTDTSAPSDLIVIKDRIMQLAAENTTRLDNLDEVRKQLDPLVEQLESYYLANPPQDEKALFKGAWRNLWFDDRDINQFDPYLLDRTSIYQVVYDSFYYNVANKTLYQGDQIVDQVHTFLKGEYALVPQSTTSSSAVPQRNIAQLRFVDNRQRPGSIPQNTPLADYVLKVDSGELPAKTIPGPIGVTGELFNAYLDDELRISKGRQTGQPDRIDLFIFVCDPSSRR